MKGNVLFPEIDLALFYPDVIGIKCMGDFACVTTASFL